MNRLNKTQLEYAENRIKRIFAKKKEDFYKSISTGEELTPERRLILLRQGKVKIRKEVKEITEYTDVTDVFDFSVYGIKYDEKRYKKECQKLDEEMARLIDNLVLGDTEEALAIINSLEV